MEIYYKFLAVDVAILVMWKMTIDIITFLHSHERFVNLSNNCNYCRVKLLHICQAFGQNQLPFLVHPEAN